MSGIDTPGTRVVFCYATGKDNNQWWIDGIVVGPMPDSPEVAVWASREWGTDRQTWHPWIGDYYDRHGIEMANKSDLIEWEDRMEDEGPI